MDRLGNLNEAYGGVNGLRPPKTRTGRRVPGGRPRPSHSLIRSSLFSASGSCRRGALHPPQRAQGSPSDQGWHLCDEVRRPQDALPQLNRQPGQFVTHGAVCRGVVRSASIPKDTPTRQKTGILSDRNARRAQRRRSPSEVRTATAPTRPAAPPQRLPAAGYL